MDRTNVERGGPGSETLAELRARVSLQSRVPEKGFSRGFQNIMYNINARRVPTFSRSAAAKSAAVRHADTTDSFHVTPGLSPSQQQLRYNMVRSLSAHSPLAPRRRRRRRFAIFLKRASVYTGKCERTREQRVGTHMQGRVYRYDRAPKTKYKTRALPISQTLERRF